VLNTYLRFVWLIDIFGFGICYISMLRVKPVVVYFRKADQDYYYLRQYSLNS
jgi:hypothetical protein